jgi:hypothetical protein
MQIDSTHRCILTICDAFHSRMPFDNCQEFSFLQEIEVFYPFHQFFHNRLQHSTHTHYSLRPAQKYLTKQRNWDTQSFTVYWVNKRKDGVKKALADHFCMQTKRIFTNFLLWQEKKPPSQRSPRGLCKALPLNMRCTSASHVPCDTR